MLNDHTDAEFARREHDAEMGSESQGDRAWSRFFDAATRSIIARGWDDRFTEGRALGRSRGLDGLDDENGYSIDSAYDAFEAGWTVERYIARVEQRRAAIDVRTKARADGTIAALLKKLTKTRKSIAAHLGRGLALGYNGNINHRGCELCDRYDDLRKRLIELDHEAWKEYCREEGSHPNHNGHDLFA